MPTPRTEDFDIRFLAGMNSQEEPGSLEVDSYSRSMNTVNRGGVVQCRPGYRCKFAAPAGNMQGAAVFRPLQGPEVILFAVEGLIYSSQYPFKDFQTVPGVQFEPHVRQLFFQQVEQNIQFNDDQSLSLIDARSLMVIQDGALTPPAVYDGASAQHQSGVGSIPLGGPMAWSGDRLWVARGASLFASDIANPMSFREPDYFATVSSFTLPGQITALAEVPNVDLAQLLVYTEGTTTLLRSGIRDRSLWNITENFQHILFPRVGCVSHRSVTPHHGLLWWYSTFGLTSLDAASLSKQTSVLPYRDNEMADSKGRLSPDLGGVAMAFFENYLLVSVPYVDRYNRHTWCMDNAPLQRLGGASGAAWNSFWTGTRPIVWLYGVFGGSEQIFYFSKDYDGTNRLWEAFSPDRLDDGCEITWYLESRGLDGNLPLHDKKFRYAEISLQELAGEFDVAVFWAGTSRGRYKRGLTKRINATRGSLRSGEIIRFDTMIFALKNQMRTIRTQDAMETATLEVLTSTDVESPDAEFIDESFQILIVCSGPGAVQGVRYFLDPPPGKAGAVSPNKELSGAVEEDETEENFVRFDGAAADSHDFSEALQRLSADIPVFVSNRTVSVTQDGMVAVASGSSESVISQKAADKVAECIATKKAVHELQQNLPKIVSIGLALA